MLAWIAGVAGPVADVEQVRVSELSTVLRVDAGGRARYLKCVADGAAREPPITAALARRSAHVPPVVAVDAARRFLLLDAFDGAPLAALLDDRDDLGLGDDEVAALRALVPELAAAAAALDADPLPHAVDHGDLWPSNVLVGAAGCAFVDWEDARIGHPFLGLYPLLAGAYLDRRFADHAAAAARIRDAYLDGWSAWAGRDELARAFDAAHDVAAVGLADHYRRQPPAVVQAHPWMREMPAFCLGRILARRASTPRAVRTASAIPPRG